MSLNPFFYLFLIFVLLSSGCATMNKSECQTADWVMIGMGDGARGYQELYIDNHRRACAKFGVTPNLNLYRDGYSQGIRQFCTARNGFSIGRRGSHYKGACPGDLEQDFWQAHALGQEIYQCLKKIKSINVAINNKEDEIEKVIATDNNKEQLLIHGELPPTKRAMLLADIKATEKTLSRIEDEIYDLEGLRANGEDKLADLNSRNIYQ